MCRKGGGIAQVEACKNEKKIKVGETKLPGLFFGVTLVSILKGRGVNASAPPFDASHHLTPPPFLSKTPSPLKKFWSILASGAHHLAGLAVSEPHLALHLATGGPNQPGCRCRPSKNRRTSKGKGFTQRGLQKKRPPLLERERSGASINGGEVGEPAPPREPLGFS